MAGFGGVAEYGITVRWNKNYLKLVRLLLERRAQFAHFGGVRFGGGATLGMDDAWAMGFDHIALCMGAGKPTVLDIPNGLARGCAGGIGFPDGAATDRRGEAFVHRQSAIRLPVVVIGGGLTAIDTATESLAYYVRQVEKFAARYRTLVAERGESCGARRLECRGGGDRRRVPCSCRSDCSRARQSGAGGQGASSGAAAG